MMSLLLFVTVVGITAAAAAAAVVQFPVPSLLLPPFLCPAILSCDRKTWPILAQTVILTGGTTEMPGLNRRLQRELTKASRYAATARAFHFSQDLSFALEPTLIVRKPIPPSQKLARVCGRTHTLCRFFRRVFGVYGHPKYPFLKPLYNNPSKCDRKTWEASLTCW